MSLLRKSNNKEKVVLFDWFAVAFGSGLIGFIAISLLLLVIATFTKGKIIISFEWALIFIFISAFLGFFLVENILVNVIGKISHAIVKIFRKEL